MRKSMRKMKREGNGKERRVDEKDEKGKKEKEEK